MRAAATRPWVLLAIACAISLHAEYIVSGDPHLKRVGRIGGVEIVPPREMLKLIEAG